MTAVRSLLAHRTVIVTGASRGIGRQIALTCAARRANVVLVARSDERPSHSRLEGTLRAVADETRHLGGVPLVAAADLRRADDVRRVVDAALDRFGQIDALVNNASALDLARAPSAEAIDLMLRVNVGATAQLIGACHDSLARSDLRHVLSISPPLATLSREWLAPHPIYTTSKYGMSMVTLGFAGALRANTLWPRKLIRTAATRRIEQQTSLPAYSRGLSAERFARTCCDVLESERNGESCLDDDIDPVGDEGVDDIFIH